MLRLLCRLSGGYRIYDMKIGQNLGKEKSIRVGKNISSKKFVYEITGSGEEHGMY